MFDEILLINLSLTKTQLSKHLYLLFSFHFLSLSSLSFLRVVMGEPFPLPHISNPTKEDVDKVIGKRK